MLSEAAVSANNLIELQLHAISLIHSIYPLPNIEPLNQLPLPELTAEELSMSDEQKERLARSLVLGSEYGSNKNSVSVNVNQAQEIIMGTSSAEAGELSGQIARLRSLMWIVTASIIVILAITFFMLYRWILNPLGEFAKQIPEDQPLDEKTGFNEIVVVAKAYNDLLDEADEKMYDQKRKIHESKQVSH